MHKNITRIQAIEYAICGFLVSYTSLCMDDGCDNWMVRAEVGWVIGLFWTENMCSDFGLTSNVDAALMVIFFVSFL